MNKLIKLLNEHSEDIFMETNNLTCLIDNTGNIIDFNRVFEELAGSIKPGISNINEFLTDSGFRILFRIISDLKLNKRNNSIRVVLNFSFNAHPVPVPYDCLILSCKEKSIIIYGELIPHSCHEEKQKYLELAAEMSEVKREVQKNKDDLEKLSSELAKKDEELSYAKIAIESANMEKNKFSHLMSDEIMTYVKEIKSMTGFLMDTVLTLEQMGFVGKIRIAGNKLLTLTNGNSHDSDIETWKRDTRTVPLNSVNYVEESSDLNEPLKILLADDHAMNQKMTIKLLEQFGFIAERASSGLDVIEAMEKEYYDVILMDVKMEKMDGLEATRYIRSNIPQERQPAIIAMTAATSTEDIDLCLEAGMDDYIGKPIRIEKLVEMLKKNNKTVEHNNNIPYVICSSSPAEEIEFFDREDLMERLNYNENLCSKLINLFMNNVSSHMEKLKVSLLKGDLKSVNFIAHSIKGLSLNICSRKLSDTALKIEEASLGGNGSIYSLIDRLQREFQSFKNVAGNNCIK